MKVPGVDWLLDCEPRPAQLEALARSYTGRVWRRHKDDPMPLLPLRELRNPGTPRAGFAFFMEMRTGKTPTILNEAKLFERDHGFTKTVVLSPMPYSEAWEKEAKRFGWDGPTLVYNSKRKKDFKKFLQSNSPGSLLVVPYDNIRQEDVQMALHAFCDSRTYLAADESVLIKNRVSLAAKAALSLATVVGVCRPASGKPNPQGVQDFYSQLRFARELEGMNFYQFRGRFAMLGGFMGKKIVGIKNEDKLAAILDGCAFVAKRKDWGTAMDSRYSIENVDMLPKQLDVYREMEQEFVASLDSGEVVTAEQMITKHMKLQQISSGFIHGEDGARHEVVPFADTPKFKRLAEMLEDEISGKTIVVYHYKHTGEMLMRHLAAMCPAFIGGKTSMKDAERDVEGEKARFNIDADCRVLIAQSNAIKYGHTLMGTPEDPCLTTMYFENSYSLDDRAQSEQRNQGEGQTDGTLVIDLCCSPVERKVVKALIDKQSASEAILSYYRKG